MTFVNVSFQIIMSFFAHEFHEFNVCARRAQKPSLLGLCRTAAKRLLKTNVSVKPNGQSSNLLEYSATARKRGLISNWRTRRACAIRPYFKHTSGRTISVRPDARDSFHYLQANFSFLPDSFHYLRRKSLLQSL